VYRAARADYSGRVTVPVLWDRERACIVNNESSEIIRMLNRAFDDTGALPGDYYPAARRTEIDAINARVYEHVNNGVYRAGFATTQSAYEEAVSGLFETLDWLDAQLATSRFLLGAAPLECDWRLLPTLLRFDAVYVGHFKCNLRETTSPPTPCPCCKPSPSKAALPLLRGPYIWCPARSPTACARLKKRWTFSYTTAIRARPS
jgi:putative glutathione S-transferase